LLTNFNNTLKTLYTIKNQVSFQVARMVQHTQIYKHNITHKQNHRQNIHHHLNKYRKSLWQNSPSFHDKSCEQSRNRRHIPSTIQFIYAKPIANIVLSRDEQKKFSLKSVIKQGCPLYQIIFNIVLEFLGVTIRQMKEAKRVWTVKQEVKLSLFIYDTILCLKDPKNS
jgi:hypothetical protein